MSHHVMSCQACHVTAPPARLHDDLETALANVAFSQSEDLGDRESGYGGVPT